MHVRGSYEVALRLPRDCSFPHKSGAAQALSPTQYGDGYLASDDEMEAHAKAWGYAHRPYDVICDLHPCYVDDEYVYIHDIL